MNILHHKSWHVRNKDNIQRVKRDEAKAAEEEKQRLKRQSIAESEARLNILRSRKSSSKIEFSNAETTEATHLNLFESEEKGKHNEDKNKEAENEKKQEKEKFEKKIGLLKYLVDDELDMKNVPWYKKSKNYSLNEDNKDLEIDLKFKSRDDPLNDMKYYQKEIDKKKKKKKSHRHEKEEKKNDKKHKLSKDSSKSDEPIMKKSKTIEELRAERLKRENDARLKTNQLLYGIKDEEPKEKIEFDDRKRKYNNQFNPEMARY